MPKQQHQPWDIKTFNKGAQKDTDKEFLGATPKGEYIDSKNMRPTALDGDTGSIEKIGGESLKYELLDNGGCPIPPIPYTFDISYPGAEYTCMVAVEVNDKFVEIWADKNSIGPPIIRVNGIVVLKSFDFPIKTSCPIQVAKNENCVGGEIYITDYCVEPMIFNIEDMMDNSGQFGYDCTNKYYLDFNPDEHKINLKRALDHPVFVEVFTTGGSTLYDIPNSIVISEGGSSMPVGYYQYAIRYVTDSGDRTVWSVATPLIPIVEVLSTASTLYPSVRTISAPPNSASGSGYSIKIRFRLNNVNNYKNLEIKRISYNNGDPLGVTPTPVLVKTILDIDDTDTYGRPCVIDFIDNGAESEGDISPDEETTIIGVINRAKAIRYYNNRLYLMNVEYSKREVDKDDLGLVPAADGNYIIPQIRNLEKDGYNNTYNSTNYKGYERGERYSYAIVFHDDKGEKSFAVPIQDDYQFPNRRDEISADTATLVSHFSKGDQSDLENLSVKCADSVSNISRTHEVFNMTEAIAKDNLINFNNVMTAGQRSVSKIREYAAYTDNTPYELYTVPFPPFTTVLRADRIQYKPLRPTRKADPKVQNFKVGGVYPPNTEPGKHEQVINTAVVQEQSGGALNWISINEGPPSYTEDSLKYKPEMFGPNNFALGGAINKITFPPWAVSSNIVRSRPARRIIAQGIGFYSLVEGDFTPITGSTRLTTKDLDKFWFYSPDIDAGFVGAGEVLDIGDTGNYSVELVSPLGFGTEMYGAKNQSTFVLGGRERNIDMISYCRVLFEDGQINAGDYATSPIGGALGAQVGEQGYVQYGKWRNDNGTPTFAYTDRSNIDTGTGKTKQFPITAFSSITYGRQTYYELSLGTWNGLDHYARPNTYPGGSTGRPTFADNTVKQFHEPIYIVNIIKEENHIDSGNVDEYFETGQYLKKESLIAVWNNDDTKPDNTQTIYLVDERWEDCISNVYAPLIVRQNQYRYIYLKNGNTGTPRKWVDITYLDPSDIIFILDAIQFHTAGTGTYYDGISGVYSHTNSNDEFYGIKLGQQGIVNGVNTDSWFFDATTPIPHAFVPEGGDYIYVNYDDTIPISFYGGDTFVGESMFCPVDGQGNTSGAHTDSMWELGIPFPYHKFEVNPRIYQPGKVQSIALAPSINRIQDHYDYFTDYIRQMAVMATLEQKLAIQYLYTNDSEYDDPVTNKIFAQVHYILVPHEWDYNDDTPPGSSQGGAGDCKIWGEYFNTDYREYTSGDTMPPNSNWTYGGIRSPFQLTLCMNIDYSNDPNTMVEFTKPKVGFNEETLFCTRIVWSETREPNMIDAPGVRTFPALNFFDISDDTGEIKHAYDATSEKGMNLYAFTNSGICLLLTDKKEVVDAKLAEIALMSVESQLGVQEQFWLSKTIGMNDEMWRSAAEYNNSMYFANYNSVYKFSNNTIGDIGKLGYAVKIREDFLDYVGEGYTTPLSACYDIYNSEYWITFGNSEGGNKQTFAYNDITKHWNGSYDYDHDKYISFKRVTYGMKWSDGTTGGTFELNKGFYMNSVIMEAHVSQACSPRQIMSKEFIRVRVASDKKPVQIDFSYTDGGVTLCSLAQGIQGTYYLKDYGAYEQYIPRESSGNRYRVQGRLLIYKIIHNLDEHFEVVDVGVQYKLLK